METEIQPAEAVESVQEPVAEAPVEAGVQEPAAEAAPPVQETDLSAKLADLEAEVARLQTENVGKERALTATQRQYQDLTARIAQVDSAKDRAELNRRLEKARDDPDEALAVVADIQGKLQRSEAEEETRRRVWGEAYHAVVGRAYQNPAFADLTMEEKQRLEQGVLQSGGGADDVLGVWAGTLREKEKMAATKDTTGYTELKAELEALKNKMTGAALNEGPDSPAPAGGGGQKDLNEVRRAYADGEISTREAQALGII